MQITKCLLKFISNDTTMKKIISINFIKKTSVINTIVHILSIALGILYFVNPTTFILFDFFGIFFFTAWVLTLLLIVVDDRFLIKTSQYGKKLNRHSYYFIASFISAILLIIFGVIFTAFILMGFLAVLGQLMIVSGFFIIMIYGFYYNMLVLQHIENREVWNLE